MVGVNTPISDNKVWGEVAIRPQICSLRVSSRQPFRQLCPAALDARCRLQGGNLVVTWHLYPIDWPQLSAVIRFRRAKGRCEQCGRPHGEIISHLGDGRWFDAEHATWRDGEGRAISWLDYRDYLGALKQTKVVLV